MHDDYELACWELVEAFFDFDFEKTELWFSCPNPLLGGIIRPWDMFDLRRGHKLYRVITDALDENWP